MLLCSWVLVIASKGVLFSRYALQLSRHALQRPVVGTYMVVALRRLYVDDTLLHERLLLLHITLVVADLLRVELFELLVTLCLAILGIFLL